jgi:hypothetical protein
MSHIPCSRLGKQICDVSRVFPPINYFGTWILSYDYGNCDES